LPTLAGPAANADDTGAAAPAASCPERGAVWTGVEALIGRERLPAPGPPPTLVVDDAGDRYRVAFGGRAHEYVDAQRDCARRAHVAAVFVALTLVPPQFLLAEPAGPPPPPAPAPRARASFRLELAPWAGLAVRGAGGGPSPMTGAAVRLLVGGARIAAIAGVGATLPATTTDDLARVQEQRVAFDLGARLLWRHASWEAGLDLEGVVTLLRIKAASGTTTASAPDPGARVGGILGFGRRPLVPFVGVFADMSFSPRDVGLVPDGVVGRTSWLRAGGLAGVAWRFR